MNVINLKKWIYRKGKVMKKSYDSDYNDLPEEKLYTKIEIKKIKEEFYQKGYDEGRKHKSNSRKYRCRHTF